MEKINKDVIRSGDSVRIKRDILDANLSSGLLTFGISFLVMIFFSFNGLNQPGITPVFVLLGIFMASIMFGCIIAWLSTLFNSEVTLEVLK